MKKGAEGKFSVFWGLPIRIGIELQFLGPLGTTWDPFGTTWDHLGPLGTTWDHLGSLGTTWDHLGPLGTTWARLGRGKSGVYKLTPGPWEGRDVHA